MAPRLLNDNGVRESMNTETNPARENVLSKAIVPDTKPFSETHSIHGVPVKTSSNEKTKWTSSHGFNRPRTACNMHLRSMSCCTARVVHTCWLYAIQTISK